MTAPAGTPTTGSRRVGVRAVAAAIAVMTAGVLPVHLTGALAPELQDDLGFGDTGLGVAVGLYFGLSALATSAGGRFTDRVGPSRSLRLAAAASTMALVALAVLVRSYGALLVALAASTVGNAIAQPGSNVLVQQATPARVRGVSFGVKQSGIPLSTFLAGVSLPLLATRAGWQWAFAAAAGIGVVAWLLQPRQVTVRRADGRAGGLSAADRVVIRRLTLGAAFGAAAVAPISTFLVRAAEDAGMGAGAAGSLLAAGSVLLIAIRVGAGAAADRQPFDRFGAVATLLAVGTAGFALFAVGRPATLVLGTVLAFGAGWGWPGLFNLGVVETFPHAPGAATGRTQAGIFVGAVIGPLVTGVLADRVSFAAAWITTGTAAAVAAVLVAAAGRSRRSHAVAVGRA